MKREILIISVLVLTLSVNACTKGSGVPQFLDSDSLNQANEVTGNVSAVDELLKQKAGVKNFIYRIGPVDLPAGTDAREMLDTPMVMSFRFDEPSWVIGFKPKVINTTGDELPSSLLFQGIVSNMTEENPICPGGSIGNPFIAVSSVLTSIEMPIGYAYPVLSGDFLKAEIVLHNLTEQDYIDVIFEINIAVKPMNEFTMMQDITPILLDVEPCTHMPLRIEPETFVERQASFRIPYDGKIMISHGVVQNNIAYVELYKKDETSPFWRSEGLLDENHNLVDLTENPFQDPNGVGFKSGDLITLGVGYDNTNTTWFNEATAAAMVYLARE